MSQRDAEERYRRLRRLAFDDAERLLRDSPGFAGISGALREWDVLSVHAAFLSDWKDHPRRRVNWPWDRFVLEARDDPSRFELAVWSGRSLCGLAWGRTARSRSHCALHFLEGAPDPRHPMKGQVLAVALTALNRYCRAIGAQEARLVEPFAAVIPRYAEFGFTLVKPAGQSPYMVRKVNP